MIIKLSLQQYLSEKTYHHICRKLDLRGSGRKTKENERLYPGELISRIHPFNIVYKEFGHTWFLATDIDFTQFHGEYASFQKTLLDGYAGLFGREVMEDFPAYEQFYCGYIEYADTLRVKSADQVIQSMMAAGSPPEQLEESRWAEYKKPHGTIAFCVSKVDDTSVKVLARCYGTALQKRIRDKSLHHMGAGVSITKMVSPETEGEIMNWLYARHKIEPVQ